MASAFEASSGDLVDRLLAALDAAEAEGGDIRGRQSAALLVVGEHPLELRVEDHAEPLVELRRLVGVHRSYQSMNEGDEHLARNDFDAAAKCYEAAQIGSPDNVEFTFWRGVMLANFGKTDEAREFLSRCYAAPTGDWKELLRRLPSVGLLAQDVAEQLV
jgi:uncharacterized Ntn-hydrolase superfamily protein